MGAAAGSHASLALGSQGCFGGRWLLSGTFPERRECEFLRYSFVLALQSHGIRFRWLESS